jgi:hypothetical protein
MMVWNRLGKKWFASIFWSFQNAHLYPKKSKIKSEKKSQFALLPAIVWHLKNVSQPSTSSSHL